MKFAAATGWPGPPSMITTEPPTVGSVDSRSSRGARSPDAPALLLGE
jgi:hypothetical protein